MLEKRKELVNKIASERISLLFEMAEDSARSNRALSKRYVTELRQISTHYKVKIPKKLSDRICTKCKTILYPGINATVRLVSSHRYIAYKCNNCGRETHIRY